MIGNLIVAFCIMGGGGLFLLFLMMVIDTIMEWFSER